ncbi:MAG: hypothetical protein KBT34_03635 [Prevotella sp.]|nr:hypothetical protein [Candidatus Prevotella equi]
MFPEEFVTYTKELFGEERWQRYLASFDEEAPVSVRTNPFKEIDIKEHFSSLAISMNEVPWCRGGYYLEKRPDFTLDPLLHAGAYYVQEASSMFLDRVLQQYLPQRTLRALDLCAAPGGKSTLCRGALPEGSILMSNEPDRRRANILMENMQKQGHPEVIVTNNYPRDYRKAGIMFDVIITDVPCSGEGMFRKDHGAIDEWSLQNVMKCAELQRSIIADIWDNLVPGGLLIYSTCTFNTREDEENVRWIMEEYGAEILPVDIDSEWNITGSLLKGWEKPVYRFIPGITKGEGLFMAALRKPGNATSALCESSDISKALKKLRVLSDGHPVGEVKGKAIIPAHAEALLTNTPIDKYPRVELSHDAALSYLRHEALVLPADAPRGFVIVTYQSLPLGFVKNIGNRANNLYPQEWKIRNK